MACKNWGNFSKPCSYLVTTCERSAKCTERSEWPESCQNIDIENEIIADNAERPEPQNHVW